MADHLQVAAAAATSVHLGERHSAWRRGTDASTSRLLRPDFASGANRAVRTAEHVRGVLGTARAGRLPVRAFGLLQSRCPRTAAARFPGVRRITSTRKGEARSDW